jgi:hypothetical protein
MRNMIPVALLCLVALSGCKPRVRPPTTPKPDDPVLAAVKGVKGAVKRIVDAKDMEQLGIYFNYAADGATGRVPGKDVILEDVKKADPKLGKRIDDGDIVLTGVTDREGLWAYAHDVPTIGGWVLTPSGPERITAEEFKKRMGSR